MAATNYWPRVIVAAFGLSVLVVLASPVRAGGVAPDDLSARTATITLATSQDAWNSSPELESTASGTVFVERACNEIGDLRVAIRDVDGSSLSGGVAAIEPGATASTDPVCPIDISIAIRRDAAPEGWLTLTVAPTGVTRVESIVTIPYKVARTSQFDDYAQLFGTGALVGLSGAVLAWIAVARSKRRKGPGGEKVRVEYALPAEWTLKDSFATTLAAVGSAGIALLSSTGLLGEFMPEYKIGGALAVSLVVAGVLVLSPIAYIAARKSNGEPRLIGLLLSVLLTTMAVATQVLLGALVVLQAGLNTVALRCVQGATVILTGLLLIYVYQSVRQAQNAKATVV